MAWRTGAYISRRVLGFWLTFFSECSVFVPIPRPSETVCPACSYSRGLYHTSASHHPCLQPRLPRNGSWGQQIVCEPQNRQDLGVKGHESQSCFHCSPSLSLWRSYPLSEKQFSHLQVRTKAFSVSADSIGGWLYSD